MQTQNEPNTQKTSPKYYRDEASALRQQLNDLVKEVRCTIAHPARPEGLRQVLADSQQMLR